MLGGMPPDEDIPPGGLDDKFVFPCIGQQNLQQLNWALWPQPAIQQEDQLVDDVQMGQEDLLDGQNEGFDQMDQIGDLENQNLAADGAPDLIPQNIPKAIAQDSVTVNPSSSVFSSSENNDSPNPDLNQLPPEAEGHFQFPDVLLLAAQVNQHAPLGQLILLFNSKISGALKYIWKS
jgi:hypothetical protein